MNPIGTQRRFHRKSQRTGTRSTLSVHPIPPRNNQNGLRCLTPREPLGSQTSKATCFLQCICHENCSIRLVFRKHYEAGTLNKTHFVRAPGWGVSVSGGDRTSILDETPRQPLRPHPGKHTTRGRRKWPAEFCYVPKGTRWQRLRDTQTALPAVTFSTPLPRGKHYQASPTLHRFITKSPKHSQLLSLIAT